MKPFHHILKHHYIHPKEAAVGYTSRMSYVIFYRGKQVIKKLEQLPVDVAYTSKKLDYSIVYADLTYENKLKKTLKFTKGFKHISPSKTFDETLNF
ncbi:MAG: hypothetical protein ACPF9F_02725 [Acholeplasmataceae bacterium]